MEFDFLIRDTIKSSWQQYKRHFVFFSALTIVNVILNISVDEKYWYFGLVSAIASVVWSFVWIKVSISAADGQEDSLTLSRIQEFFPSWRQLWYMALTGFLVGASIIAGLILLIIPGIYIAVRLSFASRAFFDKQLTPIEAYKYSLKITQGKKFWTVLSVGLASVGLLLLGILCLGVGVFVTYPMTMILNARLYRELSDHYEKSLSPVEVTQEA